MGPQKDAAVYYVPVKEERSQPRCFYPDPTGPGSMRTAPLEVCLEGSLSGAGQVNIRHEYWEEVKCPTSKLIDELWDHQPFCAMSSQPDELLRQVFVLVCR